MKKLFFLFVLAITAVAVQAQSDNLSTSVTEEAAAKAASLDASIDRRVCETSGKVTYYRKDVCEKSGKVSFEQVHYDAAAGQFVNVSPTQVAAGEKAACASKSAGKSCCASKGASASATSASGEAKASCASGSKSAGKACCSSKKAKGASAAASEEAMPQGSGAKKVNN